MHDMVALSRYVLAQHRYLIVFLLAVVVVGEVTTVALWTFIPKFGDGAPQLLALFVAMMPAGVAALILFDYGHHRDLMIGDSGCNHWMLRMPVAAWKLALVPIVLKTIWVSVLWIVFVVTAQRLNVAHVAPVGDACILFSAVMTWMLAISWRPFRNGWYRLGVLVVVGIVLYCGLAAVFASHSPRGLAWHPWSAVGSYSLAIVLYGLGVWFTIRSTELARTSSSGLIPAQGKAADESFTDRGVRAHITARRALIWHDLERTKVFARYTLIFAVIPMLLIVTFLVPLHAASVFMVLVLFACFGLIASSGIDNRAENNSIQMLPPYLAGSPLSTATIAWTRMLLIVVVTLAMSLCVVLVFIGWAIWPENRSTWLQWASQRSAALDSSSGAVIIGICYSVAIVIGALVLFLGRLISLLWINMAGREWFTILLATVLTLLFLIPVGFFLHWFIQQSDWEATTETMYGWLAWVPYLVGGLLVVKALSASAATMALWRSRITSHANILRVIAWWFLVTAGISATMFVLIPDPRATFMWCLIGTALAIPLASVLALPISLACNRHR